MATLLPEGKQSFTKSDGTPLVGGKLYTYEAGTSTPKATYADAAGTVPNTNPVILDARGEATIYWSGSYKVALKDASDSVVWTVDDVSIDSAGIMFQQSGTGAVSRTAQDKMREVVSVNDYSTPAIADSNGGGVLFVQSDTSSTISNGANLTSTYWGPKQVTTADGNKRGKFFSQVSSAPASLGNHNSIDTAFNGDLSKSHFQIEHRITGAATLGQPTTGYYYVPEASASYTYLFNSSGWNQSTSGNDGRTAATAHRVVVANLGQGDCMAFNGAGFVSGTKAGSTHFLANPAVGLFAGNCSSGSDGVYLNPYETILSDNGYDVAAIGIVNNFNRTNATGAKSVFWGGYRAQNIGTQNCDNVVSATGKWKVGVDFTMSTFDTDQAAVSLKSGQRIYFNNTAAASGSLNANWRSTTFSDYLSYGSGGGNTGIHAVVGGNDVLTARSDAVIVTAANGVVFQNTALLRFSGTGQYGTGSQTATFSATNKPGTTSSGPTQWLSVALSGTTYVIPCFPL